MKTKKLVLSAILLAIGSVLHFITPPVLFGVKPDFLLVMTFVSIYISKDFKLTLVIGLAAGIIAALTTSFPVGQIPSIFDKLISSLVVFAVFSAMKFNVNDLKMALVNLLGTLVSGVVFLLLGLYMMGQLNVFFESMTVVYITMPINAILSVLVYRALTISARSFA